MSIKAVCVVTWLFTHEVWEAETGTHDRRSNVMFFFVKSQVIRDLGFSPSHIFLFLSHVHVFTWNFHASS